MNKEAIKISVIIPVYNVERYINECVDSVLSQTYKNFEIILVDDGSPDNCPEICDNYAIMDDRITVVHKKNGGLSDARNSGIKAAKGDYVMFLDSDDFFDDDCALSNLINRLRITNPDVLIFSYKKYYEETGKYEKQFDNIEKMPISLKTKSEQLEFLTGKSLYIASAWNKIIRKSLLSEKLLFSKGKFSEDIEWCAKLMKYALSFDFICENFYCYRQRSGSISHTLSEKTCYDLRYNIVACLNLSEDFDYNERVFIFRYSAYQLSTFVAVQSIAKNCPKECIIDLSKYKWLFSYHCNNKKVKILFIITKIFGFRLTCKITKLLKKLWYR